ncbi:uncharacterized protein A4U43_C01F14790 [Asparagus officinalis]|uniref:Sox C-terminal domain-containing protein n=1 Tax=Asparagus officinalis TaxID=4686 RepID=A0A5P1FTY9_ASPOF|nr:uncharacterized protein A4U43_C01F14790 [Asparagus officinalis]
MKFSIRSVIRFLVVSSPKLPTYHSDNVIVVTVIQTPLSTSPSPVTALIVTVIAYQHYRPSMPPSPSDKLCTSSSKRLFHHSSSPQTLSSLSNSTWRSLLFVDMLPLFDLPSKLSSSPSMSTESSTLAIYVSSSFELSPLVAASFAPLSSHHQLSSRHRREGPLTGPSSPRCYYEAKHGPTKGSAHQRRHEGPISPPP